MNYNKMYNIDTHMDNVVFDMCINSDDGPLVFDYTFYGEHINGLATISSDGYNDAQFYGLDITRYILGCFLKFDNGDVDGLYRLDVVITLPGTIKPLFKEIY